MTIAVSATGDGDFGRGVDVKVLKVGLELSVRRFEVSDGLRCREKRARNSQSHILSNLESPARTVSSVAIVHHHHAVHARAVPSRTRTRARDNHIITHIHSLASRVARARVTRESIGPNKP